MYFESFIETQSGFILLKISTWRSSDSLLEVYDTEKVTYFIYQVPIKSFVKCSSFLSNDMQSNTHKRIDHDESSKKIRRIIKSIRIGHRILYL
jgi:hypothetical protein